MLYKVHSVFQVDFEIKDIVDPKKRMEEKEKESRTLLINKELLKKATLEIDGKPRLRLVTCLLCGGDILNNFLIYSWSKNVFTYVNPLVIFFFCIKDMKFEMDATVTTLESCFSLLLPTPEEFNVDAQQNVNEVCSSDFEMRLFGVIDPRHTVKIEFDKSNLFKL